MTARRPPERATKTAPNHKDGVTFADLALARLSACSDWASLLASYLLAQVEINHAYRLLGIVIFVVLQHVRVARQTAAAKNKPPLLPCLWG